jgi:hypothetical protein
VKGLPSACAAGRALARGQMQKFAGAEILCCVLLDRHPRRLDRRAVFLDLRTDDAGPYHVPNYDASITIVTTNKTPNAPYRGGTSLPMRSISIPSPCAFAT